MRNKQTVLFVTACLKDRAINVATERSVCAIVGSWKVADAWIVGRYVVMPDHIHFFCSPASKTPFDRWIRYWKRLATQALLSELGPVRWLPDVWDTQMRTGRQYEEKWQYIVNNPVRAGLVSHSTEWPHRGELNVLAL